MNKWNRPTVSVVIPTFNRSQIAVKAIESVLRQSYRDLEVIVVDDASTDDTPEKVGAIADPRLRYVGFKVNAGPQVARNEGIRMATAPIIMFLDSDDEFQSEKVEKTLRTFDSHANCDVVICGYGVCFPNRASGPVKMQSFKAFDSGTNQHRRMMRSLSLAPTSAIAVRRECFDVIGLFDETLEASQDDDILIRLSARYDFYFVKEPLVALNFYGIERVSTNQQRFARGLYQIILKNAESILTVGGRNLLARHYCRAAVAFFLAADIDTSKAILRDIYQLGPGWVFYYYFELTTGIVKRMIKRIIHQIRNRNENSH